MSQHFDSTNIPDTLPVGTPMIINGISGTIYWNNTNYDGSRTITLKVKINNPLLRLIKGEFEYIDFTD